MGAEGGDVKPALILAIGLLFMYVSRDPDSDITRRQHCAVIGVILATLGFAEGLERIARRAGK